MDEPTLVELESAIYRDLPTHDVLLQKARTYLDRALQHLQKGHVEKNSYAELIQISLDIGAGKLTKSVRDFLERWDARMK
jgi:hypothetical protein